jgi:hypothetical protein
MQSVADWLAAIPPRSELQAEIKRLRERLAVLEATDALMHECIPQNGTEPTPHASDHPIGQHVVTVSPQAQLEVHHSNGNGRVPTKPPRLSAKRQAIVTVMLRHADRLGSPSAVGRELRLVGMNITDKAVQTTMGRMEAAGQLTRLRKGSYQVPSHIAALVSILGPAGGEGG